jgi:hypothetical protein
VNAPLAVEELLIRFEEAEKASRQHPSSPPWPRREEGQPEGPPTAWELSWKATHDALVGAQAAVHEHARSLMGVLRAMSSDERNVALAIRELTYFNTWMSLRADKRWGSYINADKLAASMSGPKGRVLSGETVEVIVEGQWYNAAVAESGENSADFWFVVVAPPAWKHTSEMKLWGSGEGDTWRREGP